MFGIFILFQICIYFTFSILPITLIFQTYTNLFTHQKQTGFQYSQSSDYVTLFKSIMETKKKNAFEINIYFSAKCTIAFTTYLEFSRMMKNICIETISYRTLKYYNSEFLVVTLIVFTNYI